MKNVILKHVILAVVVMGSISIISCEEKEGQEPTPNEKPYNPFTGTWVCTDELPAQVLRLPPRGSFRTVLTTLFHGRTTSRLREEGKGTAKVTQAARGET